MPTDSIYVRPELRDRNCIGSRAPYPKDRMRGIQDDIDCIGKMVQENLSRHAEVASYQMQVHQRYLKQKEAVLRVLTFDQRLQDREIVIPPERILDARIHAVLGISIRTSDDKIIPFSRSELFSGMVVECINHLHLHFEYAALWQGLRDGYNNPNTAICLAALQALGVPTEVYVTDVGLGETT